MNYVLGRRRIHCDSSKLGVTFCDPAALFMKKMAALKSDDIILRKKGIWQKRSDQSVSIQMALIVLQEHHRAAVSEHTHL